MSESNPFQSPKPVASNQPMPGQPMAQKPGTLTTIAVLCLILGIFGVMSFCGSVFGIVMQFVASNVMENMPEGDPELQFQIENMKANRVLMIPMGLLGLFNLVVGAGLITGAIGTFSLKQNLHGIFQKSLLLAIVYCFFKLIFQLYSTWVQYSSASKMFNNPQFQGNPEAAEMASNVMGVFIWIGVAFAVLWCLGLAAFYYWSSTYISRPEIKALYKN